MNRITKWLALTALSVSTFVSASGPNTSKTQVELTDSKIRYLGAAFVEQQLESVSFNRFSKQVLALPPKELALNPQKARTTSGATIEFVTDADGFEFTFVLSAKDKNNGSNFAVYENGQLVATPDFLRKELELSVKYQSNLVTGPKRYEVVLPSFSNPTLTQFYLLGEGKLLANTQARKKAYIAVGDSISHGQGQKSASYLTFPFQLAQQRELELFNIAVGGARVSPALAEMSGAIDNVELITVLVGYNDWNMKFANVGEYKTKYQSLIQGLRQAHPAADIVAITPLFTKRTKGKHTEASLDEYRQAVISVVQQQSKGDPKLHLLRGEQLTSVANLRHDQPKDPVHLGIEGAQMFASTLNKQLNQLLKRR